ncbi:acyltransferase [Brachybacterium saurashtrense]|uniref:Acyltransferase n=1 Tax=Brachybacterium saurashtrense TaxID=556288 RepID=A0A345YNP0_9MICO|nr:acyltransferase [Brachybacterium saurashtrense]AXK45542.1 acyltransferase [Brachybacterium saurashtrense]RRR21087.1 acyltransferase [Brachybacterium saurashtrense]
MPPEHAPASPAADGAPATGDPSSAPAARRYVPLLDVIRIVAIIGVVTVHVIADHVGPDSPLAVLLLRALLAVAVPAFVMISGVLNLDPAAMRDGTGSFLGRRLRRLLPATVVWTALYVLLSVDLGVEPLLGEETVRGLLEASTFPHLYFLPLIIGLTVITPPLVGYLAEAPRRAWGAGAVAAVWAAAAIGLGPLTAGLFEEPITPLRLGALTFFLPYVGYYLLGRAAWTAAPTGRPILAALAALGTVMTAATVLAYRADWTQEPPGTVLLPTYSSPTVMAMSVAWMTLLLACGRSWQVGRRAQSWLRELGNASFGVFLLHFAVLLALRALGFPQATALDLLLLTAVVTAVSFALVVAGRRVPLVREIL